MPSIFSKSALKKLRDPEQLDNAITLASPRGWLALMVIGLIIASIITWGFLGTLPFQVQGLGVLLRQGGIVFDVNAPSDGTVLSIDVEIGDKVVTGQTLLTLSLPSLDRQIEAARRKVSDLESRFLRQSEFAQQDIAQRKENVESQVNALNHKIDTAFQRQEFYQSLAKIEKDELSKGYITRQQYEQTLTDLYTATQEIRDYRNQISETQTAQVEYENELLRSLADSEEEIIEAKGDLAVLETELVTEAIVPSPTDGTVTELAVALGDVIVADKSVAFVEQDGGDLQLYGYLTVGQAKRVSKGMRAQISPTSVERDIYGSISGTVVAVGALVETAGGIEAVVANQSLVQEIMAAGPPIQVIIELDKDDKTTSGLKWSSSVGPPIRITPGSMAGLLVTVREERPVDLVIPIYETWVGLQ